MNQQIKNADIKRNEIINAVANYLLMEGFTNSNIRALAASAGLSNRMLMYYFDTKEALITEVLLHIADGLEQSLESIMPAHSASAQEILDTLTAAGRTEEVRPLIRLFFEVVGLSARGMEPYATVANTILTNWEQWIERKLRANQKHRAREVLSSLDGRLMVDLLSR